MTYTPRRQSKRWLNDDCPEGVLAIYDNGGLEKRGGTFDRYTIFYRPETPLQDRGGWISFLGASEHPFDAQGFGIHEEMEAYKVAEYRYRVRHHATTWTALPPDVKRAVRQDLLPLSEVTE